MTVALHHYQIGGHLPFTFIRNSWLMVDFFFVLSGFVISLNYRHKIYSAKSFYQFQYKRWLRLFPLHLVMLFCFLAIESARFIAHKKLNLDSSNPPFATNHFSSFISNLLLLQNWTNPVMTWNMPSWSISAEFYTYALFGFLVLTLKKSKTALNVLSVMLVLGAGITLNRVGMGSDNISGPLRCIYSFFIGVITHSLFDSFQLRGKLFNSYPATFAIALSIIAIIYMGDQYKGWVTGVPILFSITIAAIVSTQPSTWVIEKLSNSKLVYLGTISYGLYMIHAAVWWVINQTLLFAFKLPTTFNEQGEKVLKVQNAYLADSILLIGMTATFILAHISWTRLEKRFSTSGNKGLSPFETGKQCVEKPS